MCFRIVLFISYFAAIDGSTLPTHLLITRVGPCYDPQGTIVKISEFSVRTKEYGSWLSGMINVTENIENGWKVKATMQKCMDIRNIDSCDFFKTFFIVKNGCSSDEHGQNFFGMLFNYSRPKILCPIQAGRYELQNYPFYGKDNYVTMHESKISTSVLGYTFRLEGFTADLRKIFCVEAYLQLLYIRSHAWIKYTDVRTTTPEVSVGE